MNVKKYIRDFLKKEFHEVIEIVNSFLLLIAVVFLIAYFFNKSFEAVIFYLDVILTFLIIIELTIKFFLIESNKEFLKEYWLVILLLLPFAYFSRIFYYLGLVKEEKQSEKLHFLFHEAEKVMKSRELVKTKPIVKILEFMIKKPVFSRFLSKVFSIILVSLLFFEKPKNKKKLKKSAFALDFETLVKFLLLLILLVVFVLILIKLKDSKFFTYLEWF